MEIILLLHYSIHFLWSIRSTGGKTAPQHNTTTTMLKSRCGVLGVEGLTSSPQNISLRIVVKQLIVKVRGVPNFEVPQLERGLLSCRAASQLILMQTTSSSSFLFMQKGFWLTLDHPDQFFSLQQMLTLGPLTAFKWLQVTLLTHLNQYWALPDQC